MRQTRHSENLNLVLPEGGDAAGAAALRENFAALDAALGEQAAEIARALGTEGRPCRIAWGTYAGDGTYGADNPTVVITGFKPAYLWVAAGSDGRYTSGSASCVWSSTIGGAGYAINGTILAWEDDRVTFYSSSAASQGNAAGTAYRYLALGCET